MRFHRLTVRHYKGITEQRLDFPDVGVLVVEGPNEAGKSSLVEAVDLLFDFKDSSGNKRVLEAHPVGEDEAPFVELEASVGPYRLVYAKRWARRGGSGGRGRGGTTTLAISKPRTSHHTGVDAHEKATAILDEFLDRSLWGAMRLMQGTELSSIRLDSSAQLRAALDAAAGAGADADGEGETILEAAQAEYERYYTPSTGKPRGEYERAKREVEAARRVHEEARAAIAEVERETARHAALIIDTASLRARVTETAAEREALAAERDRAIELAERLRESERALVEAARGEREAAAALTRRRELVEDVNARTSLAAAATKRLETLRADATACGEATAVAREAARVAEERARVAGGQVAATRALRERRGLAQERDALRIRMTRADELSGQIAAATATVGALRVDAAALRRVEDVERDLDRALVAQRAASATVFGRALDGPTTVTVDGAPLELGESEQQWSLTEPVTIAVPGVAEFRLVPEAGASDRAAQVEDTRRRLRDLLESYGVDGPEAARAQAERRAELVRDLERFRVLRDAALDGADITRLRDRSTELDTLLADESGAAEPEESERGGHGSADDGTPAYLAQMERAEAEAREVWSRASAAVEEARSTAEDARTAAAGAEAEATAGRRELDAREDQLVAARGVAGDEALEEAFTRAQAALALADRERGRDAVAAAEAGGGQERFAAAERVAEKARARLSEAETELVRVEAVLAQVGGQGRAEREDEAATALEAALRGEESIARRARAAKMLVETLRRHADEARAAYVAPFTAAVERLGKLVYGPSFGVVVGQDLSITARVLHGVDVPFDSLSSGAKEQLSILVRLAVAGLVDPAGGVPVLIDDALGYSDPQRIVATTAAFEHAAEALQVVMLTCTPGRYDGVRGAERVQLVAGPAVPSR